MNDEGNTKSVVDFHTVTAAAAPIGWYRYPFKISKDTQMSELLTVPLPFYPSFSWAT